MALYDSGMVVGIADHTARLARKRSRCAVFRLNLYRRATMFCWALFVCFIYRLFSHLCSSQDLLIGDVLVIYSLLSSNTNCNFVCVLSRNTTLALRSTAIRSGRVACAYDAHNLRAMNK